MPTRRSPTRAVYSGLDLQKLPRRGKMKVWLIVAICLLLMFALICISCFRRLSRDIALSDARDTVTAAINDAVHRILTEHDYDYDYFVTLQKSADGSVTAITTNTAHVNAVSAELLSEIIETANSGVLDIEIPLGSLVGSNLLLGRGPEIPVEIRMLTSSFIRFDHSLTSTGINQSRHTLSLTANVDIDIIVPWATMSTEVAADILIAETVIIGRVPETYFYQEGLNGCIGSESENRCAQG